MTESAEDLPSPSIEYFMENYFPNSFRGEWDSWLWQIRNSITTLEQLEGYLVLTEDERNYFLKSDNKKFRVTPYVMKQILDKRPDYPIRKMVVPSALELDIQMNEKVDSLDEDSHSPTAHLIHKYPDRALFLVTNFCSSYCRHCTRSRKVFTSENSDYSLDYDYIKSHTEIRDIIISGGDPLTLPVKIIESILEELSRIPHLEVIRIGTKVPIVLPQRLLFDKELLNVLMRYSDKLWINIHINHADELTSEAVMACKNLNKMGIPLGSQTVLLKGVNDSVETMTNLMHRVLVAKINPRYLYQCDRVEGSNHFRTPIQTGIDIIKGIQGHTTGMACPRYVIDSELGKIPVDIGRAHQIVEDYYTLTNYKGETLHYE